MSMWLRQSTASQEILLGRFLDSGDGNTPETTLTINNTDIKLWKEGATTLANKNSAGATHIANGLYYTVLDATDTNTLGKLEVHVHVSGALAVKREFMVVPAMVYDSLILGTDYLQGDMVQSAGRSTTNSLFTLVAATLGPPATVTLPLLYSGGGGLDDDGQFAHAVLDVVYGTGQGQMVVLGEAHETDARKYYVVHGMEDSLGADSECVVVNSSRVDLISVLGKSAGVSGFLRAIKGIALGTVGAGATTTSIPATTVPAVSVANQFARRVLVFDQETATAALRGQVTDILSHTIGGVLTVTALTTAPASGDLFTIQ